MSSYDEHVRSACELAVNVSIAAVRAGNSKIIPVRMLKYTKQDELTDAAYKAAAESIEENADFRRAVASYATPANVGPAGFEWLQRDEGWTEKFNELTGHEIEELPAQLSGSDIEAPAALDIDIETPPGPPADFEMSNPEESERLIDDELSHLRGLVNSLADEGGVASADPIVEVEDDGDDFSSGFTSLVSSSKVNESKQLSEALNRQVKLEKELAEMRQVRSALETKLSDAERTVRESKDELAIAVAGHEEAKERLSKVTMESEGLRVARTGLREQIEAMRIERDEAVRQIDDINQITGGVAVSTLQRDFEDLGTQVGELEKEIAKLKAVEKKLNVSLAESQESIEGLQVETADQSTEISELQVSLEESQSALADLRIEAAEYKKEADEYRQTSAELANQVTELQENLSTALTDLSAAREEGDTDRAALRHMRAERDALLARVSEVEQLDQSASSKLSEIEAERDDLRAKTEELVTEKGKLKGENAAALREKDQMADRLQMLQERIEPLEAAMVAEKRKVEELQAVLEVGGFASHVDEEADLDNSEAEELSEQLDTETSAFDEDEDDYENEYEEFETDLDPVEELEANPAIDRMSDDLAAAEGSQRRHPTGRSLKSILDQTESIPEEAEVESAFDPLDSEPPSVAGTGGVWDQDWPPEDYDGSSEVEESDFSFVDESDLDEEVDIDEVSELLSRTVTDFEPIEVEDAVDAPPSVFDSTTKAWVEPGTQSPVDALRELVSEAGSVLVVDGDEVCSLGWARYDKASQRVSLVTFLDRICYEYNCAISVVFEVEPEDAYLLPGSESVNIIVSEAGTPSDQALGEQIERATGEVQIGLVTDNPGVGSVTYREFQQFANEDLLDFISAIAA